MTLADAELALLARVKAADGLAPNDLADEELATARRLVYLGMLDRQRHNGTIRRYVLTPAGAQAVNELRR